MVGDISDMIARLSAVLPKRWFSETSPNLNAILRSIATPYVWLFNLVQYSICQTRIATATDDWLDLIAHDYLGGGVSRRFSEFDASYRARIQAALLREAATRAAVSSGLYRLVGSIPTIFEPARCQDTGAYSSPSATAITPCLGLAYGTIGGWGSLALPLQFFVTVTRPPTPGISMLAGYGTSSGGYGTGMISYIDLSILPGHVTDQDIQSTLSSLSPVNAVAWVRIA